MANAIEILKEASRVVSTEQLIAAVRGIGGGDVDTKSKMVRAAMIDIIIEREGLDAGDALMDEIGL